MPHTTLRSHTVLPVRVSSPAWVSRRQTSPIVRRSWLPQAKTWRTTRASSGMISSRGRPAPSLLVTSPCAPGGPACAMPRAPRRCLDALVALLLHNLPLHLQQQVVFGALPQGPLEEEHLDASTSELIDQQDLIRIFAGQAIGRVHIEPVHTARRDDITQALQ